jgi:hypothetical protein
MSGIEDSAEPGNSTASNGTASNGRVLGGVPMRAPLPPGAVPVVTDRELSWEELVVAAQGRDRDERFAGFSNDEVADRLSLGASELAAATCRWLEMLAEFVVRGVWADQGARTPGVWLSWKLGIAPSTAREHVRVALQLDAFPQVKARFAAGTLSYSKVRCLTRFGDPAFETMLLEWADDATAAQLEAVARGFRTAERARTADAWGPDDPGWSVGGRSWGDGSRSLTVRGPVEMIAALEDEIARLAQALVDDRAGPDPTLDPDPAPDPAPDTEGAGDDLPGEVSARRRATAADRVEALSHAVAAAAAADTPPDTSGLDRDTLVVTVRAHDLVIARDDVTEDTPQEATSRPCDEVIMVHDDHRRIRTMDPRVLRRLACDAGIVLVTTGDDGTPVDVGRRARRTTAALRRALMVRDGGCTFPGCGATRHLHAHHVKHWADGGATDLGNLVMVCGFHHRFVHQRGWSIEVDGRGRHQFRSPIASGAEPRTGSLPGGPVEAVTAAAPASASAEALMPQQYAGGPFDLDMVVAVLQMRHAATRPGMGVAA